MDTTRIIQSLPTAFGGARSVLDSSVIDEIDSLLYCRVAVATAASFTVTARQDD